MKKIKMKKPKHPIISLKLNYKKEDIDFLTKLYYTKGFYLFRYIRIFTIIYISVRLIIWNNDLTAFLVVVYILTLLLVIFYYPLCHEVFFHKVGKTIQIDLNMQIIKDHRNKEYSIIRKLSYVVEKQKIIIFIRKFIYNVPYLVDPSFLETIDYNRLIDYFQNDEYQS